MDSMLQKVYLVKVLLLSCSCVTSVQGQKSDQVDPLALNRADPQCWDSSSILLLEMRSPRIADTVPAFWDLMIFLKSSDNRKHAALFWDLAQVFSDIYVDCVMSRTHGLGKRQVKWPNRHTAATHSFIPHKSLSIQESQANLSKKKDFSKGWLRVHVQQISPDLIGQIMRIMKWRFQLDTKS